MSEDVLPCFSLFHNHHLISRLTVSSERKISPEVVERGKQQNGHKIEKTWITFDTVILGK